MSKRVVADTRQYLKPADINRLGTFGQEAIDEVVGGVIAYPAHWAAFTVSMKTAQVVTITPGRYFENDVVYAAPEAVDLNLITYFPLAASDEKWVALVLRGEPRLIDEPRQYETSLDPETRIPVQDQRPVIAERFARVVVQEGSAVPGPAAKPTIAETDACIAFVLLKTTGIVEIVPGSQWRAKTLYEVEGRVTAIEVRIEQLFEDTASIRTDLANVAAQVKTIPDPRLFAQIVRDTARHGQALNLPDEARNYWFDQALVKDDWDFTAGGFYRIDEGIRFAYVAQKDHTLRLLNYDSPDVSIWNNQLVMPAYTEVTRITSPEGGGRKDIANTVHTVVTAVQHTVAHERIRYGETVTVCENMAGWGAYGDRKAGTMFQAGGESWVSNGATSNPWNQTETAQNGHMNYSATRVIRDTYYETYTTYNTEEFGLSGAIFGQTFLSSQVMIATSIDLNFTRVDVAVGDVTLCLCEIGPSGAPNYEAVIARVTKARSSLVLGWNRFSFQPTLLDQGKRYAWFTVTTGNHQIMTNTGNAFTGGTLFVSSDGAWSQGSTTEDFTFRVNAARFAKSRLVVPFESLTLDGGMTEVDMIYKKWAPAATSLVWEIKAQGDTEWIPMDARVDNPLANLPPLVQLRAVFIGTEDVAPAIQLDAYARAVTGRLRNDMRAISKLRTFGFTTDQAQVVLHMDYFNPAEHTAVPKLVLAAGTVVDATAVITTQDPAKPTRYRIQADFDLPTGTPSARVRIDATTTDIIDVPFGQDVQLNAF